MAQNKIINPEPNETSSAFVLLTANIFKKEFNCNIKVAALFSDLYFDGTNTFFIHFCSCFYPSYCE